MSAGVQRSARCTELAALQGQPAASASNDSTAQWRIYTDTARRLSSQVGLGSLGFQTPPCSFTLTRSRVQGKHRDAVQYLTRALQEARQGFGPGDPHVAAACHNLAESHRIVRDFAAAQPLYHEVMHGTLAAAMPMAQLAWPALTTAGCLMQHRPWNASWTTMGTRM